MRGGVGLFGYSDMYTFSNETLIYSGVRIGAHLEKGLVAVVRVMAAAGCNFSYGNSIKTETDKQ